MTDTIIIASIISEELWNQLAKNISFDVFYNILNYTLNDIIELNPRLTVFCNYIAELLELYKVSKKDIQKYFDNKPLTIQYRENLLPIICRISRLDRHLSSLKYNDIVLLPPLQPQNKTFFRPNVTILSIIHLFFTRTIDHLQISW